ncbi:MAG: glycoside hydrolase family 16 protein [Clostridiaceae bacterium]|nr:glycoside hydrolase family 16 protein [Clostridiaceae bacterium]
MVMLFVIISIVSVTTYFKVTHDGTSKKLETDILKSIKKDTSKDFKISLGSTEALSKDFLNKIENEKKKLTIIGNGIKYTVNTSDFKGKQKDNISIVLKELNDNKNKEISSIISKNSEKKYEVYGVQIGEKDGQIGYGIEASLQVDKKLNGKEVNVYRYEAKTKQYYFVDKVLVDNEGVANINMSKYGEYFLTSQDAPRYKEENVKLVYEENFNVDGLPNKERWKYDIGGSGWGNEEKQCYTDSAENASVKGGNLIITAKKEKVAFNDYSSARLLSKDSWLYGRFEIKAKLPKGVGTWPAIWMMSKDSTYGSWPSSGELDIMEHVGFDNGIVHATTHSEKYYWKSNTQKTGQMTVDNVNSEFHVYAMEWTPHKIDFFIDGKKYLTSEYDPIKDKAEGWKAWPFDKPFYLILNIAVGGGWGGQKGIDNSIFPQSMEVDYVKVYDLGLENQNLK